MTNHWDFGLLEIVEECPSPLRPASSTLISFLVVHWPGTSGCHGGRIKHGEFSEIVTYSGDLKIYKFLYRSFGKYNQILLLNVT